MDGLEQATEAQAFEIAVRNNPFAAMVEYHSLLSAYRTAVEIIKGYNEEHDKVPASKRPLNYDPMKTRAGCACLWCQKARALLESRSHSDSSNQVKGEPE